MFEITFPTTEEIACLMCVCLMALLYIHGLNDLKKLRDLGNRIQALLEKVQENSDQASLD